MISEFRKEWPSTLLMLLILVLGANYFFAETMDTYPAYVHAWTQSDRLALAQNFQKNGFDFFHPATYNLLTKDGVTQVDFPMHDYFIAVIGEASGSSLISVFRWYNLIYSLVGFFFLYRLSLLVIKSPIRAVYFTTFIFTLPYLVYYQNGFLPSTASLANFLIGLYFLIKARTSQRRKHFLIGVFFLTISALARAPFFIFLFALFLQQLWQQWQTKSWRSFYLLIPLSAILLFISYYLYNQYLARIYGSMFLSELLYFRSFNHFIEVVSIAADRWNKQLLSPYHAVLSLILLISGIFAYSKKGMKNKVHTSILHYLLISSVGVLLFFFAFGQQFADHDYYYIDSFLPLFILLFLLLLARIEIAQRWYTPIATLCGIFFFYFFSYAKTIQEDRYTPTFDDRVKYAYDVYKNASSELEKWGIQEEDTLYILDANSTNIPFTIWGNRGYTNLKGSKEIISAELDSTFDYAVLIDSFFISSKFKAYPELIYKLRKVRGNGEISFYEKSVKEDPRDFFDQLIYYGHSDFDSSSNLDSTAGQWAPKVVIQEQYGNSLKVEKSSEFPFTVGKRLENLIPQKPINILFVADYFQQDTAKLRLVSAVNNYYGSQYLENQLDSMNSWQRIQYQYKIDPTYFKEQDELKFYFWNQEKDELFIDNIQLLIYQ